MSFLLFLTTTTNPRVSMIQFPELSITLQLDAANAGLVELDVRAARQPITTALRGE